MKMLAALSVLTAPAWATSVSPPATPKSLVNCFVPALLYFTMKAFLSVPVKVWPSRSPLVQPATITSDDASTVRAYPLVSWPATPRSFVNCRVPSDEGSKGLGLGF